MADAGADLRKALMHIAYAADLVEDCLAQSNTAGVPDHSDDHNANYKEDYIDNDNDVSNDDEA